MYATIGDQCLIKIKTWSEYIIPYKTEVATDVTDVKMLLILIVVWAVVGLMDRALDWKPEVTGSNPGSDRKSTTAPRALHSRLPTAPSVYTWMG